MTIPTSLYIHIPWCIKKCPYCDFNSHQVVGEMNESAYIKQLLHDFRLDLERFPREVLHTIFIGGGTPSLLSPKAYEDLFIGLKDLIGFEDDIEITLEANPGTVDVNRFKDYRTLGINRLSVGVQSFQDSYLKKLGRIHDANLAIKAIQIAQDVGFERINIDLMYGLPEQTVKDAIFDLETAINLNTEHLSWYELTIEPNTVFYKHPPKQPVESLFLDIEEQGRGLLQHAGLIRYEVSAYAKKDGQCRHNLNYWRFGDYLGIGAGAHGKLTLGPGNIIRTSKLRMPNSYLRANDSFIAEEKKIINPEDILFEFMLNSARLLQPISINWFKGVTGLDESSLISILQKAQMKGLVNLEPNQWCVTPRGIQFNNELVQLFLD